MRPIGAFVLVATVAFAAAGCGSSSEKPAEAPPAAPADAPNLLARLADAQALTDPKARDDALAKVANSAAKEGDVEVVEKALRGIRTAGLKDQTSFETAVALHQGGHFDGALDVAKSINAAELREQALKIINTR